MIEAAKYRKKPVVVEAVQLPWDPDDPLEAIDSDFLDDLAEWCGGEVGWNEHAIPGVLIKTLEGTMRAEPLDWIIRGTRGEFYPCKPGAFADTFEPAEEGDLSGWHAHVSAPDGTVVYDGPAPVPEHFITITAEMAAVGQYFTFHMVPPDGMVRLLDAALEAVMVAETVDHARGIAHAALNREEYHGHELGG